MLPNTRPDQGDRADRLDESVRWYVTDESIFLSGHVDQFLPHDGYDSRNKALEAAAGYDQPMYVWSEHPLIGRVAIAVAYRSEIYLKQSVGEASPEVNRPTDSPTNALRSAMPWVLTDNGETAMEPGLTKLEWFAGMAMKGLLANPACGQTFPKHEEVSALAMDQAADMLATLRGQTGQPDT